MSKILPALLVLILGFMAWQIHQDLQDLQSTQRMVLKDIGDTMDLIEIVGNKIEKEKSPVGVFPPAPDPSILELSAKLQVTNNKLENLIQKTTKPNKAPKRSFHAPLKLQSSSIIVK